ncbi:MAG: tripartite tricarboxylate transporter TctB family protein [Geminicoccaceae bacterium]|nr:tripartite tricarboxylate transporter TctB family protein [Geminicoccaceae bacterium]
MSPSVDRRTDIGVALGLIVICAAIIIETLDLPPGTFEPLGSAPVPRTTATIIILLCGLVIARAARRPASAGGNTGESGNAGEEGDEPANGYGHALVTVLLTLAYAAAIHMRLSTFAVLTTLYLVATIGWLTGFRPRLLPAIAVTALVVGFGCQYIFTRIFVVDLPGLQ